MDTHEQLRSLQDALKAFEPLLATVESTAGVIAGALKAGNKLLSCGNGGSAADALHLAEELVGRFDQNRPSLAAICLAADPTLLTCIGNDYGYESIFSRQIEGLGRPADVLVIFSSSGNSENLVRGLEAAKAKAMTTIAVLGKTGGKCKGLAQYEIIVPSNVTARVQEVHTFILHLWLSLVEEELGFAGAKSN